MDVEIGELGTLALADGLIISSPAVRTPLSSIRLYRDDRSSLPPLPFFVLLPLLLAGLPPTAGSYGDNVSTAGS